MKKSSSLRIIFVGSGVSNAQCATSLKKYFNPNSNLNVSLKILEASSIPFGRMRQSKLIHPEAEIDIGGEIIHGESELKQLMEKLVQKSPENPDFRLVEMFNLNNPNCLSYYYSKAMNSKENRNKARSLINKLNTEFENYIEKNLISEALKKQNLYETFSVLIDNTIANDPSILQWISKDDILQLLDARYAKTYGGKDLKSIGSVDITKEMNSMIDDDSSNLVCSKGYGVLRDYFLNEIGDIIHLNHEVIEIKNLNDSTIQVVSIHHPTNTKKIDIADIVVVGVPLSILQKNKLKFSPSLPEIKERAIHKLQMTPGAKVFATFKNQKEVVNRWEERFDNTSLVVIGDNDYIAQVWLSFVSKNHDQMVITGFTTGDRADKFSSLSLKDAETSFKSLLSDMLGEDIVSNNFIKSFVQNWTNEPFIQGSYSCESIESFGSRNIISESINQKLYFVGEHCSSSAPGTIHGAMRSGLETAQEILRHHSNKLNIYSKL